MIITNGNLSSVHNNHFFSYSLKKDFPLIEITDIRPLLRRITGIAHACLRQILDGFNYSKNYILLFGSRKKLFVQPIKKGNHWSYPTATLPWANDSKSDGLFLFVHGLKGFPIQWGGYLQQFRKESPTSHFIAPRVAEQGNCPLEIAAEPLLDLVKDYLEKFPGKPVTLLGASNGSRIISYIETHLNAEDMKGRQLNVVSIAGVHYGTKLIDWLERRRILRFIGLHPVLIQEFRWGNQFAKTLLNDWNNKQIEWKNNGIQVRHLFCTTLEDEKVINRSSSLPKLSNAVCQYSIYCGENHQTIVSAAQKDVINWLNKSKSL